jgi:hypothetical protein
MKPPSTGTNNAPAKILIYGRPGTGKTTLAAQLPRAAFIDADGGTNSIGVHWRIQPENYDDILAALALVPADADTVVLDKIDRVWDYCCAESLRAWHQSAAQKGGKSDILAEDFAALGSEAASYNKVAKSAYEKFTALIRRLTNQTNAAGQNLILLGDAAVKRYTPPGIGEGWDIWDLSIPEKISSNPGPAPFIHGWADTVALLELSTDAPKEGKRRVAGSLTRIVRLAPSGAWQAKCRWPDTPESIEAEEAPELFRKFVATSTARATATTTPTPPAAKASAVPPIYGKVATPAATPAATPPKQPPADHHPDLEAVPTTATGAGALPPALAFLAGHEAQAAAFLVKIKWLKPGQLFSDLPAEKIQTILSKKETFLANVVGEPTA